MSSLLSHKTGLFGFLAFIVELVVFQNRPALADHLRTCIRVRTALPVETLQASHSLFSHM